MVNSWRTRRPFSGQFRVRLNIRPFGRGIGLFALAELNICRVRALGPDEATPFLRGTGFDPPGDAATDILLTTGDCSP